MEYVTKEGKTLTLCHVARRYIDMLWAKYPIPSPPTYTIQVVGGGSQTLPHNKTTLTTPDERLAWLEYQSSRGEVIATRHTESIRFLIEQAVVDQPPPPNEWSVDWQRWGLEPPDTSDPLAYKMRWLDSEILTDPLEYAHFITTLYRMAGILRDDEVEQYETFFRLILAWATPGGD